MSRFPSGFTSEAIVKDAMSGDEANDEFSLSGLTAGAKRYAGGGAATTAMPAMLAMVKAHTKDRAYAPIGRGE